MNMILKKVCLVGDSVARGVIFDAVRGKYVFLKNCFANIIGAETGIEIENFAKFGCTVEAAERIVEKNANKIANTEYCVLEIGGNDCDFEWAKIAETPDDDHFPNTPMDRFITGYTAIIEKIKALGSKPVVLSLPPLDAKKYFAWISRGVSKENILKWLGGSEQYIYRWHEMYNLQVANLAKKLDVLFIDIRSIFLQEKNYERLLCEDGIHPNEEGHRLISNAIESALTTAPASTFA
ncbi:MAG TPA: SGNH/GDSL hydrolase family protein [Oscillospiraceae bacterium]|nr:SGNH/GDSL hydrolase family protein [Oscillospiraceae bacterium]HPS34454.1 SGNH/GDSL hydrolase family protein [Oscillospiraceae bacterium]